MGYPYLQTFTYKLQIGGVVLTYVLAIDVAMHCTKRFEGSQFLGYCWVANVTCVPYLIAIFEVMKHLIIEPAVGVIK
jgi:hypothetical protein